MRPVLEMGISSVPCELGLYSSASQLLLSSNELYIIYAAVYDVGAHKSVHHLSGK
jgi:hypothetical protein